VLEVKRLRQEREWNQTELAYHAGLAPSVISQIENDKRDPSARTLRKLAEALGVEVADLFPKAQAPLPLDSRVAGADPSGKLAEATVLEDLAGLWEMQLARGFYDRRTLGRMSIVGFGIAVNHDATFRKVRETLPAHFQAQLEAAEERFADIGAQIMEAREALEEIERGYRTPPDELAAKREARREEFRRQLRGDRQAQHA
jgi:transcriptional regulator with XRE-family HTH domain